MKKRTVLPKFPHQFFYHTGLCIRRLLMKISGCLLTPQMAVYEKAQGLWISRAIFAACELNLADHLATGPKNISELARLSETHPDSLYRLMRTLSGEGVFRELPGRIFRNTRLSSALKEGAGSMKYMILHQFGETQMTLFSDIVESIRTGEGNAGKLSGGTIFAHLEVNPRKNEIYNKAMDNSSELVAMALLSSFDFNGIKIMVDVGGGHGVLLANILKRHPQMQGILFDQRHVVDNLPGIIRDPDLHGRFSVIAGNFFQEMPPGADAYFMKNVLHAFNDKDCLEILNRIHSVMAPAGKLILLETVICPDNRPSFGKRLDLVMLTGTAGGRERTREEFQDLLGRPGFRMVKIIRTVAPFSVIEAVKK